MQMYILYLDNQHLYFNFIKKLDKFGYFFDKWAKNTDKFSYIYRVKPLTPKKQIALHKKIASQTAFIKALKENNIPLPITEYKFHPTRKWRFDYYWQQNKFALEVEGGVWTGGRHIRGTGFIKDMEKYNSAAIMGFRIIRTVPNELTSESTIRMIKELINI